MEFILEKIIDAPSFAQSLSERGKDLSAWRDYQEKVKQDILANYPSQEKPVIVHTLGCPASGKTTLLNYCRQQGLLPAQNFLLGFDAVMEAFPAYQEDMEEHGAKIAFENWEVPARSFGYELLAFLLQHKINIVFEHSGARADHVELLKAAKNDLDYRVILLDTKCSLDIAFSRISNRERYLPSSYIGERRRIIEKLRGDYYALCDEKHLYNTEHYPPILMEQT